MASLHFYYSTMNAGKSTNLLQANYNYHERGMKTFVLKPAIDTREGKAVIKSRIGLEAECILFEPHQNLFVLITDMIAAHGMPACVFIDEAQFMSTEQVIELTDIVDEHQLPVMCYGLRTDFQGKLFPGSAMLFARADKLVEVRTICWCGKNAFMVLRLNENGEVVREGDQVKVGGNDSYISVCRRHFRSGQLTDE
jgi:thymidine kinase